MQASGNGQPETSAASDPVSVPETLGLEYIRAEVPEPVVITKKLFEPAAVVPVFKNTPSSNLKLEETIAKDIPVALVNVDPPKVVLKGTSVDQMMPAVNGEKKELQQSDAVLLLEQRPPKLSEKAQEPTKAELLQKPVHAVREMEKKTDSSEPVHTAPTSPNVKQDPKFSLLSEAPELVEKTTTPTTAVSQLPKGNPAATTGQCVTTIPNALPVQPKVPPKAQHFEKPQELKKSPPVATSPTASRINDDALFKTPSPVDRKNRVQRIRSLSRSDLPPPTPLSKAEVPVLNEEPETVKVVSKNSLAGLSVDLIFLALTGEDPVQAVLSDKSLSELVLDKKIELEQEEQSNKLKKQEPATDMKSANTGEDSRYAAADLKKLKREVNEELKTSVASTETQDAAAIAKAVKKMSYEGSKRGISIVLVHIVTSILQDAKGTAQRKRRLVPTRTLIRFPLETSKRKNTKSTFVLSTSHC